jgi:hypothetical protein
VLATIGLAITFIFNSHQAGMIGEVFIIISAINNIVISQKYKKLRKFFLAEEEKETTSGEE